MTKSTTAKTTAANNTTPATEKKNRFLAMFQEEDKRIETEIADTFASAMEESKQLTEATCEALGIKLSDKASDIYGYMLSANASEGLQATSGAQLAEAIQSLIEAYYNGDKAAMQPVVDACSVWIATKHEGDVKTANIPNNMRLLVSRRSQAWAKPEEGQQMADYKLVISVEGNKGAKTVVIKETKLGAGNGKSKAQKVFNAVTKLDALDRDELLRLIATNADLLSQFASLSALQSVKQEEVTKDTVSQLEVRRNAAAEREDELQHELDEISEVKLGLCDQIADIEDRLQELELQSTATSGDIKKAEASVKRCKKEETKAAKQAEVELLQGKLAVILEEIEAQEEDKAKLVQKREKAMKSLDAADAAYNNQAHLCSVIGKELETARTALTA